MDRNRALWVLTALLVLGAVALFLFLPGIWGFLALGLAAIFVPIPRWQELLSKSVRIDIKTAAIVVLTVLTVGITFVTIADALRQPPADTVPTGQTAAVTEGSTDFTTLPTTQPTTAPATVPETEPTTEPTTVPETEPTTEPPTQSTQPTAPATAATEPSKEHGENCDYVLNTSSKKFHYPDCGSVKQIKDENRKDCNGTREELLEDGYTPCGRCKP